MSWQEQILLAFQERDNKEGAHSELIESCNAMPSGRELGQ